MAPEIPHQHRPPRKPQLEAFQVIFVMLGLVVLPAALTLQTVHHSGRLEITSANPTPLGYPISLSLFVVPVSALLWWLCRRRDLGLQRRACVRTLAVLVPLG
jgi:xanthine/uracil permease